MCYSLIHSYLLIMLCWATGAGSSCSSFSAAATGFWCTLNDWPALPDTLRMERRAASGNQAFHFQKRKDGRSCHHHHFYRTLVTGEKIRRGWKKKKSCLYCFFRKLFSQTTYKWFSDGVNDCKNDTEILKHCENTVLYCLNIAPFHCVLWKLPTGLFT